MSKQFCSKKVICWTHFVLKERRVFLLMVTKCIQVFENESYVHTAQSKQFWRLKLV